MKKLQWEMGNKERNRQKIGRKREIRTDQPDKENIKSHVTHAGNKQESR
jgi:hypothetical protein